MDIRLENLTKIFWKILQKFLVFVGVFANILFLLGLLWILLNLILEYIMPARIPNGYALVPVWFDRGNVRLVDPEWKEIVPAHVSGIGWCDEIVYGTHYTEDGPKHGKSFIYDGKKHQLKYIDFPAYGANKVPGYDNIPDWPTDLEDYMDIIYDAAAKESCPGREQKSLKND
jgi:hypothetical protein